MVLIQRPTLCDCDNKLLELKSLAEDKEMVASKEETLLGIIEESERDIARTYKLVNFRWVGEKQLTVTLV